MEADRRSLADIRGVILGKTVTGVSGFTQVVTPMDGRCLELPNLHAETGPLETHSAPPIKDTARILLTLDTKSI